MGQIVNGQMSPVCAFDLGGAGEMVAMQLYEKVLLVFQAASETDTGTVVAEAMNGSLTVALDRANPERTVMFRKLEGWIVDPGYGWAVKNPPEFNLASLAGPPDATTKGAKPGVGIPAAGPAASRRNRLRGPVPDSPAKYRNRPD